MPSFVLVLMSLLGAALAAILSFLAEFLIQAQWTGLLGHLPGEYIRQLAGLAFQDTLLAAVLLGGPIFMGLHRLGQLRAWTAVAAGLLVGGVTGALLFWPLKNLPAGTVYNSTARVGGKMVQIVANGTLTSAGWLHYGQNVLACAVPGAVGGLVFWLIWRRVAPALERLPVRR